MATLYKVDGSVLEVHPRNGTEFTLEELQGFVGGYIEIVPLRDGTHLICNEEGKLNGLPLNDEASAVWVKSYGFTDLIVGDALVCSESELG